MKHLPKYVVGAGDVFVRVLQYVQERGFQTRAYCANVPLKREKRGTTYYYLTAFQLASSLLSLQFGRKSRGSNSVYYLFEVPQRCEDQFCGKVTFPFSVFNMQIDVLRTPLGLLKIILSVSNHLFLCIINLARLVYLRC